VIVVAGENVVDLVPVVRSGSSAGNAAGDAGLLRPVLGGGPANMAVAIARQDVPVAMAARLGADAFGTAFRDRLVAAGVRPDYFCQSRDPSTLALVTLDDRGSPHFDFWLSGAADFGWQDDELPDPLRLSGTAAAAGTATPADRPAVTAISIGSVAAFIPPGADTLARWAAAARSTTTIAVDPNIRPALGLRVAELRDRVETLVGLADVVKVSDEDVAAAYPGESPEDVATRWLAMAGGPELVVVTRGAAGVTGMTRLLRVDVPAPKVEVVDTIGAGDTAMGTLLAELHRHDLLGASAKDSLAGTPGATEATGLGGLTKETLTTILATVTLAAALACTRPGADPPTRAEIAAATTR
jgi:fructokinase